MVPTRREGETLRPISPSTSANELEALRTFCAFAVKRGGWIPMWRRNSAHHARTAPPTQPFISAEVTEILATCDSWGDKNPNTLELTRANVRAMVLVMLYSGLRISDTVQLRRDAVDLATGKMLLRIMKTGKKQYL